MVASVAVLSDIHGVLPALDAVLAEPDAITPWAAGQLTADHVDWLARLPDEVITVVCGHTHMPFTRLAHRRQIINPGSVAMPYGRQGAHWALLAGGTVSMRRAGYDPDRACELVTEQSSFPEMAEWADYFLHSRASDAEALEVFGPRDGRGHA